MTRHSACLSCLTQVEILLPTFWDPISGERLSATATSGTGGVSAMLVCCECILALAFEPARIKIHTHARTHTLTRAHSHTHTHMHTQTHARTHTRTLARMHTHTSTRTHPHTHARAYMCLPDRTNFPKQRRPRALLANHTALCG